MNVTKKSTLGRCSSTLPSARGRAKIEETRPEPLNHALTQGPGGPAVVVGTAEGLAEALTLIRTRRVIAVRVPNFVTKDYADRATELVMTSPDLQPYENVINIFKAFGTPFYGTKGNPSLEEDYWRNGLRWMSQMRLWFGALRSPIDEILLRLDEQLRWGARIVRNTRGQLAWVGLPRVFIGSGADPHCDHIEWDAVEGRLERQPIAQVAMNVYLEMPASGGEIAIWRLRPDERQYEALRDSESTYGLDESKLGPPDLIIYPEKGDLILFDAHCVHAVRTAQGRRVTISGFAVYFGDGLPWGLIS